MLNVIEPYLSKKVKLRTDKNTNWAEFSGTSRKILALGLTFRNYGCWEFLKNCEVPGRMG